MFFVLALVAVLATIPLLHAQDVFIPQWVKKDAVWWHEDKISDVEFTNGIKWLIEKNIVPIQFVALDKNSMENTPQAMKSIAYYWAIGDITDKNFVSTIRYLIKEGAIKMDNSFESTLSDKMKMLSVLNETEKSVVVVPVLTSSAYSENGFYAYYRGECNTSCLTVKVHDDIPSFVDSANGIRILKSLGYNTITDIDIDKNPHLLDQYDEVILLHSEYVTQREFNAITSHPHVLYLYPNALYARVSVDYWNNTVTLIRGHGYPEGSTGNGFGWKFDNSKLEYNNNCENWNFYEIKNGKMLNCYPEGRLDYDLSLLQAIKDF